MRKRKLFTIFFAVIAVIAIVTVFTLGVSAIPTAAASPEREVLHDYDLVNNGTLKYDMGTIKQLWDKPDLIPGDHLRKGLLATGRGVYGQGLSIAGVRSLAVNVNRDYRGIGIVAVGQNKNDWALSSTVVYFDWTEDKVATQQESEFDYAFAYIDPTKRFNKPIETFVDASLKGGPAALDPAGVTIWLFTLEEEGGIRVVRSPLYGDPNNGFDEQALLRALPPDPYAGQRNGGPQRLGESALDNDEGIRIAINGEYIHTDVPPFIDGGGRTQVPLRAIAEALGCGVEWDGKSGQITISGTGLVLEMWIGSREMLVNGRWANIDTAPVIVKNKTFVPARVVAELFGYVVGWNELTRTVTIE